MKEKMDMKTLIFATLLFLLSLAYYFSFYDQGVIPNDEGHLVHFAERFHDGEIPGRDFHLETYIFGRYALLAGLFDLFGGPHLLIERSMWVVMRSLCVVMLFLIGVQVLPRNYAFVVSLFVLVLPGPWHKTPYAFTCLLGLLCLFFFMQRNTKTRMVLLSLTAGVGIMLRQDVGLIVIALTGLLMLLSAPKIKKAFPWVGAYLGLTLIFLLPMAAYLYFNRALGMVMDQCFFEKVSQHMGLYNFTERLGSMWKAGDHFACFYFALPPLVYLGVFIVLLLDALKKKLDLKLLALFIMAMLTINQAYNHALIIRLLQCAAPTCLLGAFLVYRLVNGFNKRAWTEIGAPLVLGLLFCLGALEIMTSDREQTLGKEYLGSMATKSSKNKPIKGDRAGIYAEPTKAAFINQVVAHIQSHTKPDEPIYVASNDSILYFLSKRKNPSRFAKFFMPGEPEDRRVQVANALKAAPPNYIITTKRMLRVRKDYPAIRFIQTHYKVEKVVNTGFQKQYCILKKQDG